MSSTRWYRLFVAWAAGGMFAAVAAPAELVGLWTFNDESATTAFDSSGNGLNGVITGATRIISPLGGGRALVFDPADGDDEVVIDPAPVLNINGSNAAYSVAAWLRIDDVTGFNLEPGIGKTGYAYGLTFYSGGARVYAYGGTGGNNVNSTGGGSEAFTLGSWHHLVATYDHAAAGPNLFLYIDGVPVHSKTSAAFPPDNVGTPFTIGRNFGNPSLASFRGLIDEVALYNEAIDASTVIELYNAGPAVIDAGASQQTVAGTIGMEIATDAGVRYRLEGNADPSQAGDWAPTGALLLGNGSTMSFFDPGTSAGKVYRVVVGPDL